MIAWTDFVLDDARLLMAASETGVTRLSLQGDESRFLDSLAGPHRLNPQHPVLAQATHALHGYFHGRPLSEDVPLDLRGTPFQLQVWAALRMVPFGQVRTYAEVARAIQTPRAARAVGAANAANPVPVFVPCHRVVATGVQPGGCPWKERLLRLEGHYGPDSSRSRTSAQRAPAFATSARTRK